MKKLVKCEYISRTKVSVLSTYYRSTIRTTFLVESQNKLCFCTFNDNNFKKSVLVRPLVLFFPVKYTFIYIHHYYTKFFNRKLWKGKRYFFRNFTQTFVHKNKQFFFLECAGNALPTISIRHSFLSLKFHPPGFHPTLNQNNFNFSKALILIFLSLLWIQLFQLLK